MPSRGESAGKSGDVSVTALSFLSQEHLIVTGCEADATIKLWDLRSLQSKQKSQLAISQTAKPTSHSHFRNFGTTSINLSGDGSRLFALCKDSTVYAYSTAHLMLGDAPEFSQTEPTRRFPPKETKTGLGPLYGYRHPKLHVSSFYVKTALRKAMNEKCEMLAVGSHDGCAILFPTDERYLPKNQARSKDVDAQLLPKLHRQTSKVEDDLLISRNGTPLIRGHNPREVGAMTWTSDGNLITVGDDYLCRAWYDDRVGHVARSQRLEGESSGRQRPWGYGWADVTNDCDRDDDCDEDSDDEEEGIENKNENEEEIGLGVGMSI